MGKVRVHYEVAPKVYACRWIYRLRKGVLSCQPDAVTCPVCAEYLRRREITRERMENVERWEQ